MTLAVSQPLYRQQVSSVDGGTLTLTTSEVATSATYVVTRLGEAVASGSATVTPITGGVTFSVTVSAGLLIQEGYELELTPDTGPKRRLPFDVVRTPYGPLVTLNDLEELRPGATRAVDQIAGVSDVTSAQVMSSLAGRAREQLDDMLRDRLLRSEDATIGQAEQVLGLGRGEIFLRGYAILDVDRVRRIERFLALHEYHLAMSNGDDLDGEGRLAAVALGRAKAALENAGRMRVDIDQDGKADTRVEVGRTVQLRRVQA